MIEDNIQDDVNAPGMGFFDKGDKLLFGRLPGTIRAKPLVYIQKVLGAIAMVIPGPIGLGILEYG